MALCTLRFSGKSLAKQVALNVLLPDAPRGRLPVLYLLHGLSDDYTAWQRYTRLENYVKDHRLILVMPDGARSFYINSDSAGAYEDHIVKDVVGTVDRVFPTIARRNGRAVAGLSMGGYGAMLLGLKHPGLFAAISSHSGALAPAQTAKDRPKLKPLLPALNRRANDCRALARAMAPKRRHPAIRFDCGTEDDLLDSNRRFHAYLTKMGVAHTYEEHPGDHDWAYWDRHISATLDFVLTHMHSKG